MVRPSPSPPRHKHRAKVHHDRHKKAPTAGLMAKPWAHPGHRQELGRQVLTWSPAAICTWHTEADAQGPSHVLLFRRSSRTDPVCGDRSQDGVEAGGAVAGWASGRPEIRKHGVGRSGGRTSAHRQNRSAHTPESERPQTPGPDPMGCPGRPWKTRPQRDTAMSGLP